MLKVVDYLCNKYGARFFDLTPYTRVWETRSGNTYIVKKEPFRIFHRYPNGKKHNFWGKEQDSFNFIDYVERCHGNC